MIYLAFAAFDGIALSFFVAYAVSGKTRELVDDWLYRRLTS